MFTDKYISATDAAAKPDAKKITISNDAYAIGEMMQELKNIIEQARISLLMRK